MQAIKDVIPSVLASLQNPESLKRKKLAEEWASVVGEKAAPHTKPSLGKNKKLYVWVDQSALAFELSQKYKQTILRRARALVGEESVEKVCIRVGQLR